MNLEESDLYKEQLEKNSRRKKTVMIFIATCAILMFILVGLIIYINYMDSITEKFFIDNKQVEKIDYKAEGGVTYINLQQLSDLLGYNYTRGTYLGFDEREDSGYMQNDFEILAVTADEEKYSKYIKKLTANAEIADIPVSLKNTEGYSEIFEAKEPIKFIDGNIYASIDDITDMLNIQIEWKQYRKNIYSLNYMVEMMQNSAVKLGYKQMSEAYENLKAAQYGYIIVSNQQPSNNQNEGGVFGVYSLEKQKEVISVKYKDIKFAQNTRYFYVTTDDGTMGILDQNGGTVIEPTEYQNISVLDDNLKLYLVQKDNEYGVINGKGKVLVHAENDRVGLGEESEEFKLSKIDNKSLLFNKYIPLYKNKKYGVYDVEREKLALNFSYDALGYVTDSEQRTTGNEESVLTIPKEVGIEGIVINYNGKYGIYDVNEKQIILTCVCSKIYAITKSGKTDYYMEYDNEEILLSNFLKENKLNNIDKNGKYTDSSKQDEEEKDNPNVNSTNTNTIEKNNSVEENNVVENEQLKENTIESNEINDEEINRNDENEISNQEEQNTGEQDENLETHSDELEEQMQQQ